MVRPGIHDALEPAAERGRPFRIEQVLAGEVSDEVLHLVVAQGIEDAGGHRRCLARDELGVVGAAQPRARRRGDLRRFELRAHDRALEEVRLDELAEAPPDLVFALRDDRGVRDRDAEGVAEQRRHGEPVGEGADHAALRGRAHIAEPRVAVLQGEGDDEHDRHEHQRPEGHTLHEPERPAPLLVGGAEEFGGSAGHAASFACGFRAVGRAVAAAYSQGVIDDIKKRALHRTSILEGQVRGLAKMIENEDYCMDIIAQSRAVQKALASLDKLLIENHLRTHVAHMFAEGGAEREQAVAELLKAYDLEAR